MDIYYIKGRNIVATHSPASMSWSLRKILDSQQLVEDIGGWDSMCKGGKFQLNACIRSFVALMRKLDGEEWFVITRPPQRSCSSFGLLFGEDYLLLTDCLYGKL